MSVDSRVKQSNHSIRAKTGDVLFIKSKAGLLDFIMKYLTKSCFIHAAVLIQIKGLWFVIETNLHSRYSYQIMPIEWWFARHINDDIYLGQMPESTDSPTSESKLRKFLMDTSQALRPYKLSWLIIAYLYRILFGNFRPNLDKFFKGHKPLICSTLIQEAWEKAGIIKPAGYMNPGELVDCVGGEQDLIPLDNKEFLPKKITPQYVHGF